MPASIYRIKNLGDFEPSQNQGGYLYTYYFLDNNGVKNRCGIRGKTKEECTTNVLAFQTKIAAGLVEWEKGRKNSGSSDKKTEAVAAVTGEVETVKIASARWLDSLKGINDASTVETYFWDIKRTFPYIGCVAVKKLTPEDVIEMLRALKEKGRAFSTVEASLKMLSMIMDCLEEKRAIVANVCKSKRVRKFFEAWRKQTTKQNKAKMGINGIEVSNKEKKSLTEDEAEALVRVLFSQGYRYAIGFLLGLTYGLRPGEALGITRDNIYKEEKVISIRKDIEVVRELKTEFDENKNVISVSLGRSIKREGTLKSETSYRDVYINDTLLEVLEYHERILEIEQNKCKGKYGDSGYIVCTKQGESISTAGYSRSFGRVMKKLDAMGKTPHGLRHTFSSLARYKNILDEGIVGYYMGHNTKVTVTGEYSDNNVSTHANQPQRTHKQRPNRNNPEEKGVVFLMSRKEDD